MKKRTTLWTIALLITFTSAYFQRKTGPTYPISKEIIVMGNKVSFTLPRSWTTGENCPVRIEVSDHALQGQIKYKRYKSYDDWKTIPMQKDNSVLTAFLPSQPPAGKIAYYVLLKNGKTESLTDDEPVIIRFKGAVPAWILIPHIIFMFLAMLFSTRSGIEVLAKRKNYITYTKITIFFLFIGGFVLGPLMQKYAFGSLWTGIPFGTDLTDNKTLISMIFWLFAWFKNRKSADKPSWVLAASIVTLIVYLIPHSLLGSEIDYRNT
ncbi:MAG: hypothetical protein R6V04_00885 [bacterium]